jgi:hypothetical protein
MPAPGTAFYRHDHVYFVLSQPNAFGKVLCVNLTTLDDECIDNECTLDDSEYSWIKPKHPTAVAFSRAAIWDAALIDQCLQDGTLGQPNPSTVPGPTVAKVVALAKQSVQLTPKQMAFL